MVRIPDVKASIGDARALDLGVATQAKIGVARHEHFLVDRTVRVMAGRATFAQRRVLENKGPCLVAMTLRAAFVLSGHGQPAFWLEDVAAVGIVTLHAAQVAFDDLMMLRQAKFSVNVEMTLKTG
jgi:hypothetical protein